MREKLKKLWASVVAFFTDEAAFDRQMRGVKHGLAGIMVVITTTVIPFSDDPSVWLKMVEGWTLRDWAVRIIGGFVSFYLAAANIHKGMSIEEIHAALAAKGVLVVPPTPPNNGQLPPSQP